MAARNEDPNVQARSTLMLQLDVRILLGFGSAPSRPCVTDASPVIAPPKLEQGTHVSFCRLFVLPGAEALAVDHARARLHEGLEAGKVCISASSVATPPPSC
jgi:hypothetical protein